MIDSNDVFLQNKISLNLTIHIAITFGFYMMIYLTPTFAPSQADPCATYLLVDLKEIVQSNCIMW